jgi:hypothetical protein
MARSFRRRQGALPNIAGMSAWVPRVEAGFVARSGSETPKRQSVQLPVQTPK